MTFYNGILSIAGSVQAQGWQTATRLVRRAIYARAPRAQKETPLSGRRADDAIASGVSKMIAGGGAIVNSAWRVVQQVSLAQQIKLRRTSHDRFDPEAAVCVRPEGSMKTSSPHWVVFSFPTLEVLAETQRRWCVLFSSPGRRLALVGSRLEVSLPFVWPVVARVEAAVV